MEGRVGRRVGGAFEIKRGGFRGGVEKEGESYSVGIGIEREDVVRERDINVGFIGYCSEHVSDGSGGVEEELVRERTWEEVFADDCESRGGERGGRNGGNEERRRITVSYTS